MNSEFLPFHKPDIGEAEAEAVLDTLRSGWLTTGSKVKQFEADFAKYLGCSHAVAVNSCTAALHLALEAVGIEQGDEVIVPTMTFTASAEVVLYFKAKPVFVDCLPDTFNVDPDCVERAITAKTKAIIPVHFGGQPCDMDSILEIARSRKLYVIEDAAHALPSKYRGKSWHNRRYYLFFFLRDKNHYHRRRRNGHDGESRMGSRMRMMSLHGISHDAWKRYTKEGSWYYEVLHPGFKYNLTDIGAAIGVEQLKKCNAFAAARNRIAMAYSEAFSELPESRSPYANPTSGCSHLYVIQLGLERLKISRDQFIEALRENGIGTSVHFIPLHLHPYYRDKFGHPPDDFPNATKAYRRILSLPIYPKMAQSNIEQVIEA